MKEEAAAPRRGHTPGWGRDRRGAGAMDRAAVRGEPAADLPQPFHGLGRDRPVGARPDVEEQVGIAARRLDEIVDQLWYRLVPAIRQVEAPRVVHRERRLER